MEPELGLHRPWLERAARGLGFTPADAEDLAQTVAATFLEVMPRFEGRSSVRTFLFGILRRKAAELRRQAKRAERPREDAEERSGPSHAEGDARLEAAQLGRALDECIGELPPKQRGAVELRFIQERETEEAGRELGVSANYLGVLLNRARAHLRDCIEGHGI